jgi:hypothetical protein
MRRPDVFFFTIRNSFLPDRFRSGFIPRVSTYSAVQFSGTTSEEAKNTAKTIDWDRTRKIFTDYSESWRWTTAELIQRYLNEECDGHKGGESDQVMPSTGDRELNVLAQVYNTAIDTWRIKVNEHPMSGMRRPQYFNERDHRLKAGQEERLIAESQKEESPFVETAIRHSHGGIGGADLLNAILTCSR